MADAESPSRNALAKRLGVSTHTIQRILVDGDVPELVDPEVTLAPVPDAIGFEGVVHLPLLD